MKVSGFSFIRNAIKYDYPIVESIKSILPICDEFVIAVGESDDKTNELIQSINSPKIKIINTVWDDSLRKGGEVLAKETDKAFAEVAKDSVWAFYIQGDEVIHEKYLDEIKNKMQKFKDDAKVEGLLFNYIHFYGSYDFIGDSRKWYRREVRIVRNDKSIHSFRDAQGFRKNNKLLKVKQIDAKVYHYGWVKHPEIQQAKQKNFHLLWHDKSWVEKNIDNNTEFDYLNIDSLRQFEGEHPGVIKKRVLDKNWTFSFDPLQKCFSHKLKFLNFVEKKTGWRPGEYKNYRLI
jgi:hypothetical protein